MKEYGINYNMPIVKTFVEYKSLRFEARQYTKCKEEIFTEDLAMKAISKIESRRLDKKYIKNPIRIGHSRSMTFPKEVAEVFGLENSRTKLKIHPNTEKGRIEISIN